MTLGTVTSFKFGLQVHQSEFEWETMATVEMVETTTMEMGEMAKTETAEMAVVEMAVVEMVVEEAVEAVEEAVLFPPALEVATLFLC